jgi:asparagine synthase (glutamine-hydrolysing)
MILGILDKRQGAAELRAELASRAGKAGHPEPKLWASNGVAFCSIPRGIESFDEASQPFATEDGSIVLVFEGKIHNLEEIEQRLTSKVALHPSRSGEALVHLYAQYGDRFPEFVNGKFAFALWDRAGDKLILGRDHLGIESLFYYDDGERLVFSSSLRALMGTGWVDKQLNHNAVLQYLLYNYNPLDESLFRNVHKLPPAHTLSMNGRGAQSKRYWQLSFAETLSLSDEEYQDQFLELLRDAVRIRLDPDRAPGVLLSGGTDSSAILGMASELWERPIDTYSFRCQGRSYDESQYAKFVADRFGANYTEVPYGPDRVESIAQVAAAMDEPFCDIGIELATFILGRAAQGNVSYVFNGEGGDELFAGHPVYVADKVAAFVDLVPKLFLKPAVGILQRIPDSDNKRNLRVMLKRFGYSLSFPCELLSHRWRIYYTASEIEQLGTSEFLAHCDLTNMFEGMIRHGRGADGKDQLSRSLFSDFHTLIDFYLRRLGLLRASGVESRPPLMDHRLVEFSAKVPSSLKIRGWSDTKHIYRKMLEPIVPKEILYDRPKLGHSVPMKNWLRDDPTVSRWMTDVLSDPSFTRRGLFDSKYLDHMIETHRRKTHNHSHRLWGLVMLELWMRSFVDN